MARVVKIVCASLALVTGVFGLARGVSHKVVELADALPGSVAAPSAVFSDFRTVVRNPREPAHLKTGVHASSAKRKINAVAPSTLIRAGDSRAECAELDFQDTGLVSIETAVEAWDTLTNSTANCLSAYLNGEANWHLWTEPWVASPEYGYVQWVRQSPTSRQLVLQVDLIPTSLQDTADPLSWERSCDAGHFDSYATTLGRHLVAAGLGHSVIRLGAEANTDTETDFIGNTVREEKAWAKCFDNEVTGLRAATGSHFLIVWNPNACVENIPYNDWYPGNAYVDILGLDFYDFSCMHYGTPISFADLSNEPLSLTHFIAYAKARNKPMSFPEWGLIESDSADDPAYIAGVGATVDEDDFAFETYFNAGAQETIELSLNTPESLAAFQQWFGSGTVVLPGSG